MKSDSLTDFIGQLQSLETGLVCLSRLNSAQVLANSSLAKKAEHAESAYKNIKYAKLIGEYLSEYFRINPRAVEWMLEYRPDKNGILENGLISSDVLKENVLELSGKISTTVLNLKEILSEQYLLSPAYTVIEPILLEFSSYARTEPLSRCQSNPNQSVTKVLTGPSSVESDPAFAPTYSLLQTPVPGFGDSVTEVVPYFWGLAIRESLAAELCALCSLEYDCLPLEFYVNMCKQAWDEMRHSQFFFDEAVKMLPELKEALEINSPLLENINQFLKSGSGLPIPKEKNLYEAILNANLVERLILLHRDTETPGILRLKEKIDSPFCQERPWLAEALEIVMRDEVTHSRFGHTWLEYLVPSKDEQDQVVAQTELLRGVYLLTSFASQNEVKLGVLLKKYSSGEIAPISGVMDSESNRENLSSLTC